MALQIQNASSRSQSKAKMETALKALENKIYINNEVSEIVTTYYGS